MHFTGKLLVSPIPPLFDAPSGRTPCDINVIYTPLESTFTGLQFIESIFIRSDVLASQNLEIAQNSEKIRPYSSSRSSKVIDLGVSRKLINMRLPVSH